MKSACFCVPLHGMRRRELFDMFAQAALGVYDPREAQSVARMILDKRYGIRRLELALDPDAEVADAGDCERIAREISQKRPAQYITGIADFCGLEFEVQEGVLIPRPETEELVEWIAGYARPGAEVLDVGTGSGAIAVALALQVPQSRVTAIDISPDALAVAARNAERHGARVKLCRADVLDEECSSEWASGAYDVVVSNPPYIPAGDRAAMHGNVTEYEPCQALFVPDDDPLLFYRRIAALARGLLVSGGALYFEIYERSAADVARLLAREGFTDVEVRRDINGRERMARGVKN